eukprot:UN09837
MRNIQNTGGSIDDDNTLGVIGQRSGSGLGNASAAVGRDELHLTDFINLNITNANNNNNNNNNTQNLSNIIPQDGIYDINSLVNIGKEYNICPYYLARYLLSTAHVVVYNYHYMLDPKVNPVVDKHLEPE